MMLLGAILGACLIVSGAYVLKGLDYLGGWMMNVVLDWRLK